MTTTTTTIVLDDRLMIWRDCVTPGQCGMKDRYNRKYAGYIEKSCDMKTYEICWELHRPDDDGNDMIFGVYKTLEEAKEAVKLI
jgi:hypothetical protein